MDVFFGSTLMFCVIVFLLWYTIAPKPNAFEASKSMYSWQLGS